MNKLVLSSVLVVAALAILCRLTISANIDADDDEELLEYEKCLDETQAAIREIRLEKDVEALLEHVRSYYDKLDELEKSNSDSDMEPALALYPKGCSKLEHAISSRQPACLKVYMRKLGAAPLEDLIGGDKKSSKIVEAQVACKQGERTALALLHLNLLDKVKSNLAEPDRLTISANINADDEEELLEYEKCLDETQAAIREIRLEKGVEALLEHARSHYDKLDELKKSNSGSDMEPAPEGCSKLEHEILSKQPACMKAYSLLDLIGGDGKSSKIVEAYAACNYGKHAAIVLLYFQVLDRVKSNTVEPDSPVNEK
jgi:antitoxin component HigA of HigAB toxin-antitoxin module